MEGHALLPEEAVALALSLDTDMAGGPDTAMGIKSPLPQGIFDSGNLGRIRLCASNVPVVGRAREAGRSQGIPNMLSPP